MRRAAVIAAAALALLVYLRLPFDLVPDVAGPIGLVDDLLVAIALGWWLKRSATRPSPNPRRADGRPDAGRESAREWDPWRVLDLPRGSPPNEITRAYREQMKLYHPDRVASLGRDLQALAHEKALEIRRAYEELTGS